MFPWHGWAADCLSVQDQREIVDLVRMNLEEQKEKHLARNERRDITEVEIGSDLRPRSGNMARASSSQKRAHSKSKLLPLFKGPMKESRAKRGEQIVTLTKPHHQKRQGLGYGR
jgi:hypothetical protein